MDKELFKKILWYGIAAILILTPIARGSVRIWAFGPVMIAGFALIFLWLFKVIHSPWPIVHSKIDRPVFLFSVLAAISFAFSVYKHDSLLALTGLFCYIGIYYLALNEFGHKMRENLLKLIVVIGTALSAYGLLQYLGIFGHSWWHPPDFLSAAYVNHNHFAGYLELAMPAAIGIIISSKRKIALTAALVIMATAFIMTQSRGAWCSLSASLMVMLFVLLRKRKAPNKTTRILTIMLCAAVVTLLLYFSKDIISQRLETVAYTSAEDVSFDTRLRIWNGTIEMISHDPVTGTGIGTFIRAFSRYRPLGLNVQANAAHNDYLQMAAEMGILAPALMLWIFFAILIKGFGSGDPLRLGCAAGVLSLALHALVDFNFHIPANMLLFTIYAAFIMRESARE